MNNYNNVFLEDKHLPNQVFKRKGRFYFFNANKLLYENNSLFFNLLIDFLKNIEEIEMNITNYKSSTHGILTYNINDELIHNWLRYEPNKMDVEYYQAISNYILIYGQKNSWGIYVDRIVELGIIYIDSILENIFNEVFKKSPDEIENKQEYSNWLLRVYKNNADIKHFIQLLNDNYR